MMKSSFPFLQIAKQFDLPYEQVLQAAEKLRHSVAVSPKFSTMPGACLGALDTIENAVLAENERRASITQLKQDTINGKFIPPDYNVDLISS